MIDLHIHTTCSDGTDDVITVLKKAESKKLKCISITDHNTCKAYEEISSIKDLQRYYTGKIIPGVELNTKVLGIPIEILGYNVNPDVLNPILSKSYPTPQDRNRLELSRIYEQCKKLGIDVGKNFLENFDSNSYTSKYLHTILIKNIENKKYLDEDSWNNSNVFYRKYMSNPNSPFYIFMDDILPDFVTASNMIKQAGGLVFLPHIFEYKENSMKILNYILENYVIDGIECFYTTFTDDQNKYLIDLCNRKNLLISGGSDYHGTHKPNVDLGCGYGSLNIPDIIISNWNIYKLT